MCVYRFLLVTLALGFLGVSTVAASETSGTIEDGNAITRICKDASCASFGRVNWKPTGSTPVTITDSGITGYAWGDEIGWINFNPTDSGVTINPSTGALSGYAYANTGSWINFNPTDVAGGTDVGVTINAEGQFAGWAWVSGANGGWMKFDCALPATCVKTDWRPLGSRTSGVTGVAGGGGGARLAQVSSSSSTPLEKSVREDIVPPVIGNPIAGQPSRERSAGEGVVPPVSHASGLSNTEAGTDTLAVVRDAVVAFYKRLRLPEPNVYEGSLRLGYNSPLTLSAGQSGHLVWDFTQQDGNSRHGNGPLAVILEIPKEGVDDTGDERSFSVSLTHSIATIKGGQEMNIHRNAIFAMAATGRDGTSVTSFANPIKVTMVIPSLLEGGTAPAVYYRTHNEAEWFPVPGVVFTDMTAVFYVDHFTDFAVLEHAATNHTQPFTSPLYYYGLLCMLVLGTFFVLRFMKSKQSN